MQMQPAPQGESWDIASEYADTDAPEVEADLTQLAALIAEIEERNRALAPTLDTAPELSLDAAGDALAAALALFALVEDARRLAGDLRTYASCRLSVDSQDAGALALQGRLQAASADLANAREPLSQFLDRVPDNVLEAFLQAPAAAAARFALLHSRKRRHELLPLAQETLVNSLAQDGVHAWGRLYDQLSGTLSCSVEVDGVTQQLGLAAASGLLLRADAGLRERAWRAINAAWREHAESCAAAINAISGWRLEMCRRRSGTTGTVHFLDAPLHMNRIERATLDTVLDIAKEAMPMARRAARLQARAYGRSHYCPWDQRAPAPAAAGGETLTAYSEAVDIIANAYGDVHEEMGEFVSMMARRRWIEGTVGSRKRPGAYCTGFHKSNTPRVYMTFSGGDSDVITLAHELGHAFHFWMLRELPDSQRRYGMSIAETASTFGESVVRQALLERAQTPRAQLDIVWEEASAISSFLLNIPTRFEFERNLYDARAERPQRPQELEAMMSSAWQTWYGDCLAEPDPLFWANKLHFYISELSFYNFPYLFGYLFSQGVYARREDMGDDFYRRYCALLSDTGRTTAEELAARHLDVDLTQPDFWRATLSRLESRVDAFERLIERVEAGEA